MWHCGTIIAVTAWAVKARRDAAPPRFACDIWRARDAKAYLQSVCDGEPRSAEELMDRVHDEWLRRGVSDDALTRLGRLLRTVNDPGGAEAYALTVVYTSALRARGAEATASNPSNPSD